MRPPLQSVALLTGPSSGIGRALAFEMAPDVKALALVARRRDRLEALAAELKARAPQLEVFVRPCDLLDAEDRAAMLAEVEAKLGPVELLINNAGVGQLGLFEAMDLAAMRRMMSLNVEVPIELCQRLIPGMATRGRGGILNISSGFGMSVLPGVSTYAASKHALTAFTEALGIELRSQGIVVTQVCPGPVATEFEAAAGNPTGMSLPDWVPMSAERCARIAWRGFRRGRALVVPGLSLKLLLWLNDLTPRWLLRLLYRPLAGILRRQQQAARADG